MINKDPRQDSEWNSVSAVTVTILTTYEQEWHLKDEGYNTQEIGTINQKLTIYKPFDT